MNEDKIKLFIVMMFYSAVVLGFIYASIQLFQMNRPTPAFISLFLAFLSIPSIKT